MTAWQIWGLIAAWVVLMVLLAIAFEVIDDFFRSSGK